MSSSSSPPSVYLSEDRTSGLEARTLPNFGATPSTVLLVSDQAAGGIAFMQRATVIEGQEEDRDDDKLLARIGLGGNMYVGGSLEVNGDVVFTGGVYAGSLDGGPGQNAFDLRTWEKGPGDSTDVFLKNEYQRVGIGTTEPEHALHVEGGSVAADYFHGKLAFSNLTQVPVSRHDVPGLVRLNDAVDEADSTRAATSLAVQKTHSALAQRVSRAGDTMNGPLNIKDSRLTVTGENARLGINLANPTYPLDVMGDINFTGRLLRNGHEQQTKPLWEAASEGDAAFFPGSISIGKTLADKKLDVEGDIQASSNVYAQGLIVFDPDTGLEQHADDRYVLTADSIDVANGGTGGAEQMDGRVLIGSGTDPIFAVPELFWDRNSYALGIRTAKPQQAVHVEGNILARNMISHRLVLSTGVQDGEIGNIDGDDWDGSNIYGSGDSNAIDTDLGQFLPSDVQWDNDAKRLSVMGAISMTDGLSWIQDDHQTGIDRPIPHTLAVTTNGNERMRVTSDGHVGINTSDPLYDLEVRGEIAYHSAYELSDRRIKTNVRPITDALDTIKSLRGVRYNRDPLFFDPSRAGGTTEQTKQISIDDGDKDYVGFIAQEVLQSLPEVVDGNSNTGFYSVSYGNIVAVLTEAVKALDEKCNSRIDQLRSDFSRLEERLDTAIRSAEE